MFVLKRIWKEDDKVCFEILRIADLEENLKAHKQYYENFHALWWIGMEVEFRLKRNSLEEEAYEFYMKNQTYNYKSSYEIVKFEPVSPFNET